ncbi:hypothetical protein CN602_26735 [Bacillus cereus]|uniref:hypothetical protein n=1 Tax=Bacillus cereus TaxID=1396 RepID=UPI000BEF3471|nr:hypothetical protein [Bacillus cereus]PEL96120.1 hypothetical protein CN602_26735 [Bacillus cereus]
MFEKLYWICVSVLDLAGITYVLFITKNKIIGNTRKNKQSSPHATLCFMAGEIFIIISLSIILFFSVLQFLRS